MSRRLRWAVLGVLLAAATWLAWFGDKTPPGATARLAQPALAPGPAAVAQGAQALQRSRTAATPQAVEALQPRTAQPGEAGAPVADLFSNAAWRVAPALALAPAPAPAAVVAALVAEATPVPAQPYRLIGKKFELDAWAVFLGRNEMSFIVGAGDTLEGAWRVQRIEPPTLTLVHLASGQQQTLDIGVAP